MKQRQNWKGIELEHSELTFAPDHDVFQKVNLSEDEPHRST